MCFLFSGLLCRGHDVQCVPLGSFLSLTLRFFPSLNRQPRSIKFPPLPPPRRAVPDRQDVCRRVCSFSRSGPKESFKSRVGSDMLSSSFSNPRAHGLQIGFPWYLDFFFFPLVRVAVTYLMYKVKPQVFPPPLPGKFVDPHPPAYPRFVVSRLGQLVITRRQALLFSLSSSFSSSW